HDRHGARGGRTADGCRPAGDLLPRAGHGRERVLHAGVLGISLGAVHGDADRLGRGIVGRRRIVDRQPLGVPPVLIRLLRAGLDARRALLKMGGPEMAPPYPPTFGAPRETRGAPLSRVIPPGRTAAPSPSR